MHPPRLRLPLSRVTLILIFMALSLMLQASHANSQTFNGLGSNTLTVPANVIRISYTMYGGGGGGGYNTNSISGAGTNGIEVSGNFFTTPGNVLYIYVGAGGGGGYYGGGGGGAGYAGGGGGMGGQSNGGGGGGGGSSAIFDDSGNFLIAYASGGAGGAGAGAGSTSGGSGGTNIGGSAGTGNGNAGTSGTLFAGGNGGDVSNSLGGSGGSGNTGGTGGQSTYGGGGGGGYGGGGGGATGSSSVGGNGGSNGAGGTTNDFSAGAGGDSGTAGLSSSGGNGGEVILSWVAESTPTLSFANSITSNAIDVITGSASDNALITATCTSGDTCSIYDANGVELSSGTTTTTLAYNALMVGQSAVYANDITSGALSGNYLVRRITVANSIPITLTNYQDYAIPANAQLDIAFSGHNYTSVESNTLNNTVLYFQNGTVDYSWLEGGVTNAIEYPRNVLSTSANVFFWFKVPSSNFLPANTGIATTNVIYMGFGTPGINIMDGNFIGEAPQLSTNYAQYDNGAKIFNYYLVNPTSTNGFTLGPGDAGLSTDVPPGSYFDTPNAFSAADNSNNNYLYSSSPAFAPGNVITYWFNVPESSLGDLFFESSSSGSGQFSRIDERGSNTDSGILLASSWTSWSGGGDVQNPVLGSWDKVDVVMTSSNSVTMYDTPTSNTPLGTLGSASTGPQTITYSGNYFGINGDSGGVSNPLDYWDAIIVRDYLPGGSLVPAAPYPASYYTAPTLGSLSSTSHTVILGSNAVITDSGLHGGLKPYSYQWYASNTAIPTPTSVNEIEANTLLGIGTGDGEAQSQNLTFATNSNTLQGNYYFVLYATDSYPTTVNSLPVTIAVTAQQPSSKPSGGGPVTYYKMISDNINSTAKSSGPVITIATGSSPIAYYQNQLPISLIGTSNIYNISFACSVHVDNNTYEYQNQATGLGFGFQCGKEYSTSAANIDVIYQPSPKIQSNSSTTEHNTTVQKSNRTIVSNSTTVPITNTQPKGQQQSAFVSAQPTMEICNVTPSNNYNISYPYTGSVFHMAQSGSGCFTFTEINLTAASGISTGNLLPISILNVSTNARNATISASIKYTCSLNSSQIGPYLLVNGTWNEIIPFTTNASDCMVSFTIPKDPIIAILEKQTPVTQPETNSTPKNNTMNTAQKPSQGYNTEVEAVLIAIAIIILILFAWRRKKHKKGSRFSPRTHL